MGANPAFVASPSSPSVSTKGFNRGEGRTSVASILQDIDADEAWRPALAAFYRSVAMFMRSDLMRQGFPLDNSDRHEIAALRAAFEVAP